MDNTAGGLDQPLFGLLLDRIHFKTLPQTNGLISSNSCDGGVVRAQDQTEYSVLVA